MGVNAKLVRFDSEDGVHAVVIESDDRVAYAYLLEGERIVADVWLYNVAATPETVDWSDREQMPFLNPAPYCMDVAVPDLSNDLRCDWRGEGVEILVAGEVLARLVPGAKPGWSRLARKDGPLAKKLDGAGPL